MNILITNFEITQYSGSEINAATIAKRFKQLGHTVYMAALDFGYPLLADVQEESIDVLINILDGDFDFSSIEFDIVWAHHSFILDWLIFDKGLRAKKIVNSSLSPVEVFEVPPVYANELNMSIANSKETEDKLKSYEINNTYLLENYSFRNYFERDIKVEKLKNIAIVSNHVPEELFEVVKKLSFKNYNVQIYGIQGKKELITHKVLENYDLIITIGKTVQYGMSLKIPVYIYDRFGGPGYLTMENMELNRAHNFSGRGYFKKDADTIFKEITEQFSKSLEELEPIKQYAMENFCFEEKIDDVMNKLVQMPNVDIEGIRQKYEKYSRNIIISKKVAEYLQRRNAKRNQMIEEQTNQKIEQLIEENNKLKMQNQQFSQKFQKQKNEIEEIKGSRTWRCIRKIRNLFNGRK